MSKSAKVAVWVGFVVMLGVGCNPISTAYFLFRGDSKVKPEYALVPKDGKKEVTVAILVAAQNPPMEFAAVDRELSVAIGRRLHDQTKDGKCPIKAVEMAKLDRLKAANPEWRSLSATEIGKQLGADYVLDLTLASIGLYEPGSGKLMYQGRATIEATVYDVAAGQENAHYFANPVMDSRPSDSMLMAQYKTMLLSRLADEVTWKHVAHANDQQIAPPTLR